MKHNAIRQFVGVVALTASSLPAATLAAPVASAINPPNIVYILADDLGYGDIHAFNPEGKIPTPHIDQLAAAGMEFTDAHASSSVCTPSRYSILTGRYCWRTGLQRGVLGGFSPPLVEPGRMTVASLLQQHGYATACIGKWHLGLNWPTTDGRKPYNGLPTNIDFTKPIRGGPTDCGFDYFFGISASLDMPPYVYIENDRTVGIPDRLKSGNRAGLMLKGFQAVNVLPEFTRRAVDYIDRQTHEHPHQPFFLYVPVNAPHAPIVPTAAWQGKSKLNRYGDFVMQFDDSVGQVMQALERNGLADNTLVIVTSDNGCSPAADIPFLLEHGHHPSYVYRGYKSDIWDGGHRIPLIARWPGHIQAGSTNAEVLGLMDLLATCADIVGAKLPANASEDGVTMLPAFRGESVASPRAAVVHHSIDGAFAIREGQWKLELCPGSGGWGNPKPGSPEEKNLPPIQLYDLAQDIGEKVNVEAQHPDVVARLTKLLEQYVANGRSTPGPPERNKVAVQIEKASAGNPGIVIPPAREGN